MRRFILVGVVLSSLAAVADVQLAREAMDAGDYDTAYHEFETSANEGDGADTR